MTRRARTYVRKADQKPTWTNLVLDCLIRSDDFMSMEMLRGCVAGSNVNQISAALFHLARRHAVDSVVGGDGKLWWFATPASDDRTRTVLERTPEPKGNRTRGPRKIQGEKR